MKKPPALDLVNELQPLVSVIIPAYNATAFIAETLAAVQQQTYPHWECIIVNDGSTDEPEKVVASFLATDSRITLVHKQNGGLSSARNYGLSLAKGQWIQFLDADDTIEPRKLEAQLTTLHSDGIQLQEPGLALAYCGYAFGQQNNIRVTIPVKTTQQFSTAMPFLELISQWETQLSIPCHCFLFSADFFQQQGIRFDESLPNHEDFDCWLTIFSLQPAVSFVNEVLCRYRISDRSMSTDIQKMRNGFLMVLDKHIGGTAFPAAVRQALIKRKNELLFIYRRFGQMNLEYKIVYAPSIIRYYAGRIAARLKPQHG